MKKLSLLLVMTVCAFVTVQAQRVISGTVKGSDGSALIGASVLVKGTTVGTVTDFDGYYSLTVPEGQNTLVFTYTGYDAQEVMLGASNMVNVTLEEGVELGEIVVTGLGIKREEKALGYSVQRISGEDLAINQETNILNAMAGKVSGVQILSGASSQPGGSAKVRIRGVNGLTGGDPLFVVDGTPIANNNFSSGTAGPDYGNLASTINPDDVEDITVLKGPAATAIYGERGKFGVVLITTKKGKPVQKGVGVTVRTGLSIDKLYLLPEYQNEYAGGYDGEWHSQVDPVDGKTYNVLEYYADESWGPRMDGTPYRPWYSWYPGTPEYGLEIPLSPQPDNVRDFFETGMTNTNSVEFTSGTDRLAFRAGLTNLNQKGIFPNSKFTRNSLALSTSYDITDNLTFDVNLNVVADNSKGRVSFGYSPTFGNPVQSFNQWFQRQLTMKELEEYKTSTGVNRTWNIESPLSPTPLYWDSPYFTVFENAPTDSRNRYFGNVGMTYKLTDNLSIRAAMHRDNYANRIEERIGSGGLELDYYRELVVTGTEDNYEVVGSYDREFGGVKLDLNVGGNLRQNRYRANNGATAGGLSSPNLFTLAASVDRPVLSSVTQKKNVQSVFGAATLSFFDTYYIGGTLRNDWSSALPVDNNSYLYSSLNAAVVFSEWIGTNNILSFGKLRGSIAQVGSDLDPYQIDFTYGIGTPYGSDASYQVPDQLPPTNLRPAITTSWEAGIDLAFFNAALALDFTIYNNINKDDILAVQIPGSSGFSTALINAGKIVSKGFEVGLRAKPVSGRNFKWTTGLNIARNTTTVEELYEDLENYKLADGIGGTGWGGLTLNAFVGQEWGLLKGRGYTYLEGHEGDENYRIISASGGYVATANKDLGSILPDFTGGFLNSFQFGPIQLDINLDFQIGGKFFSVTKMFNNYSGLGIESAATNDNGKNVRDAIEDGGGIKVTGVLADGTPHEVYVPAVTYYARGFGFHEFWIYDASYVKIRDISLGYSIPTKVLGNGPVQNLRVALVAKNPLLIYSAVKGIDPSEILPGSNNLAFEERGQLPSARSFGINITVGF